MSDRTLLIASFEKKRTVIMIDTKLSKSSEDDCKIGHSNYLHIFFLILDLGTK